MEDIRILKRYIRYLKNVNIEKCVIDNTCKKKTGSKAKKILICDDKVIKGPLSSKRYKERVEYVNKRAIKIDSITMDFLLQTINKEIIRKNILGSRKIEHYNDLCKMDDSNILKFISKRADYKRYPTLEDFILEYDGDNKVDIIKKCLLEVFKTLDVMYDVMQFHYCDPKCNQLFLFDNGTNIPDCMLADLDKCTFTLNINQTPYRIFLTTDYQDYTLKDMCLYTLDKLKLLYTIIKMRFENKPRSNNLLEKLMFISSACLLLKNYEEAKTLRDYMLKSLGFKNDFEKIISLNQSKCKIYDNKEIKNLYTPAYIIKKMNNEYVKLKSRVNLKYKDEKCILSVSK
jgi:hypothetical protein